MKSFSLSALYCLLFISACSAQNVSAPTTSLQSWRSGEVKQQILTYLDRITNVKSADYVEPKYRLAAFDMDGTVMCEKPKYIGSLVAETYLRKRALDEPDNTSPLYKAARDKDTVTLKKNYKDVYLEAFHNLSPEVLHKFTRAFMSKINHADRKVPLDQMIYAPMRELIQLLQQHEFSVYLVSASNQEFIRAWSEDLLGIPPENVIGSVVNFRIEHEDSGMTVKRQRNWIEPYNDRWGKPVRFRERTGRWPLIACGNGDGDVPLLKLASANPHPHLVLVLDHDDDQREYVYPRHQILKAARENQWLIISMKDDFTRLYDAKTP